MGKAKRKGGLTGVAKFVFEVVKATESEAEKVTRTTTIEKVSNEETPHTAKKRKRNDGSAVVEELVETSWVEKYDATGLVPRYTHASQVPEKLQKYFSQRHRYFSLYSTEPGCLLDEEGWYSVTPELLADQIAERCRCDTILDAFCGVGGNSIAFAKTCQRVIALDTSPTRLALARHNAQIYGVADRIEFILADYISFAKSYMSLPSSPNSKHTRNNERRKIDVVFLSPPWGGPSYLSGSAAYDDSPGRGEVPNSPLPPTTPEHPSYSLSSIQPIHGADLFDLTRKITQNVAYYLPRNTRLDEISQLISLEKSRTRSRALSQNDKVITSQPGDSIDESVEIEEEWMGNKLKALTCYFGGLAGGQEYMF